MQLRPALIPPDAESSVLSDIMISSMEKCPTTKKEVQLELKQIVKEEAVIPSDVQGIKEDIAKKKVSLMRPSGPALDHPASDMLLDYADNTCPVDCGENWSWEHFEVALLRGPNISAKSKEAITVLRGKTMAKVEAGFVSLSPCLTRFENQMFDDSYTDIISSEELVVFVDDYIAISNAPSKQQLLHISRVMLHGIHSIFPPPESTGHAGEDLIAQKKMLEGEGFWQDCKEILGWIFDGKAYTISLPDKKISKIITEINRFKKVANKKQKCKQTIPLNKWQKLAGPLMHASFGLVGSKAMFSLIWKAMEGSPKFIRFNPALLKCLKDWKYIFKNMLKNPTDISLLVAEYPHYTAYLDACGLGAGGVLLAGSLDFPPIVWQIEWPDEIKVLFKEHKITINDLELAAIILAWLSFENILTDMSSI